MWHVAVRVGLVRGSRRRTQRSLLSVGMQASASCEHPPSHSICSAESRAGELSRDGSLRCIWTPRCQTIGARLSHVLQVTHWHALQIWPSFMRSRNKIYRFQSHLHGIASFHRWHNELVTLQILSNKDCSKYIHADTRKCHSQSCVLLPHTKSWIISKGCTSGEISYGLQGWSTVKEWLHPWLGELLVEGPDRL